MKRRLQKTTLGIILASVLALQNPLFLINALAQEETEPETTIGSFSDPEDPERFQYSKMTSFFLTKTTQTEETTTNELAKTTETAEETTEYPIHNEKFADHMRFNGIDVSKFQGTIDWPAVAADGVDFSIIRLGYRGYGYTGNIVTDPTYTTNIEGAEAAGLDVGVYFFTQAITVEEAIEEANYVLTQLDGRELDLPVYIDIEEITYDIGRQDSANLNNEQRTAICDAFCDTIEAGGYEAGIYANKYWLTSLLDSTALAAEHHIWLANYTEETDYAGDYEMWQYTPSGVIDGITANTVDLDVLYSLPVSYEADSLTFNLVGETQYPVFAGSGKITYDSSNTAVAVVNADGSITSVGPGVAVITAISNNGTSDFITVTVASQLTGYMRYHDMFLTEVGSSVQLSTGYHDAANPVVWASSDPSIATVNAEGIVTATGYGTAQIIAADSTGSYTACTVQVEEITDDLQIGDCNFDGTVNAIDAALTLTIAAENGTSSKVYFSERLFAIYDLNGDALIDALDAVAILNISSNSGVTPNS